MIQSRLKAIASRGDTTRLADGYTGLAAMWAQVSSFIDAQVDGSISQRRPISFAPEQLDKLPARRVVEYAGEHWIVGDAMADMWNGQPIRYAAATKRATHLCNILTPGEAAIGAAGLTAYCQLLYLKDTVNTQATSDYSPQYEVHFASSEDVNKPKILKVGSNYLQVRSVYPILDGYVCAVADELGSDANVAVSFYSRGAYDAASDTFSEVTVNTTCIVIDHYKLYTRPTAAAVAQQPGDLSLLVKTTTLTPTVGMELTLLGGGWRIVGIGAEADAHRLHVRRV